MITLIADANAELNQRELRMSKAILAPNYLEFTKASLVQPTLSVVHHETLELIAHWGIPNILAPRVEDFQQLYTENLKVSEHIISFHPSAKISKSYQNAKKAANLVNRARITLVDSGVESCLLGAQILRTARLLESGQNIIEVCQAIEKLQNGQFSRFIPMGHDRKGAVQIIQKMIIRTREIREYKSGRVSHMGQVPSLENAISKLGSDLVDHFSQTGYNRLTFVHTPQMTEQARHLHSTVLSWGLKFKNDGLRCISPLIAPLQGEHGIGLIAEPMPDFEAPADSGQIIAV